MNGLAVGMLGLGRMGTPMARTLLVAGFALTVYNRTSERAHELVAVGARAAASLAELAAECDVVVSMLADDAAAEAIHPELLELVGGEWAAIERAMPVLSALSRAQHVLGSSGYGAEGATVRQRLPRARSTR
jgi:3-hydroxyisobutyrate dehydrogenase-like beta-hydroxyacid dehydrogenase